MRITLLLAIAAALASAQDPSDHGAAPSGPSRDPTSGYSMASRAIDTPATEVCVGDIAPNFSYQAVDARWRRLRDLARDHPVLLVFGANEGTLRIIEGEREALMDLGAVPVAITGSRAGATRAMVQRQDLRYTVLADPQGVIASQFNAVDPANGHHLPAWFVLDSQRRVRALGRADLPMRGYAELVCEALGLPSKAAIVPAAR